ncbi:MAG: hypothetical protein AAF664_14730 [Planctomycetota bacterium]
MISRTLASSQHFVLVLLIFAAGCTAETREPVSANGRVTLDEKVVSGVVLTLQPTRLTTGPKATVPVRNGEFSVSPEAGLHGGEYRVRFSAMPGDILSQLPPEMNEGLLGPGSFIASEFDVESVMTWDLQPGEQNERDFDLTLE